MTIKIMLNKDEEINKLALDPEVQLKIKAAIMDAIASRAVKAVEKDAALKQFIEEKVHDILYDRERWGCLNDATSKKIEEYVKRNVENAIFDMSMDEKEKYIAQFRKALDERIKALDEIDVKEVFANAVDRYIRNKMR